MSKLKILQIPVLSDNYVYLAHDPGSGATAVVDPAVHEPVLAALQDNGWTLSHILNTHHHGDNTGGNMAIKQATNPFMRADAESLARNVGLEGAGAVAVFAEVRQRKDNF